MALYRSFRFESFQSVSHHHYTNIATSNIYTVAFLNPWIHVFAWVTTTTEINEWSSSSGNWRCTVLFPHSSYLYSKSVLNIRSESMNPRQTFSHLFQWDRLSWNTPHIVSATVCKIVPASRLGYHPWSACANIRVSSRILLQCTLIGKSALSKILYLLTYCLRKALARSFLRYHSMFLQVSNCVRVCKCDWIVRWHSMGKCQLIGRKVFSLFAYRKKTNRIWLIVRGEKLPMFSGRDNNYWLSVRVLCQKGSETHTSADVSLGFG